MFSWAISPIFPASDDDFRTCCFSPLLPVQLQTHLSIRLPATSRTLRVTSKHCRPTAKLTVSTLPLTSSQPVPPECLSTCPVVWFQSYFGLHVIFTGLLHPKDPDGTCSDQHGLMPLSETGAQVVPLGAAGCRPGHGWLYEQLEAREPWV